MTNKIKSLSKQTSSQIKSQHTYKSILSIIKELLENAIDAKSSKILIHLTNESVSLEDNGSGISDLDSVCKEGCTSKMDELTSVFSPNAVSFSYGFRGMALFSLSNISKLTIHSNHRKKVFFTNEVTDSHFSGGTIVQSDDIFYNTPVRRRLLNAKKEVPQIVELIKAYLYVSECTITLYYHDKVMFSKKGMPLCSLTNTFSQCIDTPKFSIYYSPHSSSSLFLFYLTRPIYDNKLKHLILSLTKGLFILVIKEKCDINTSSEKNEVLIRNREMFVSELKESINELISNVFCLPSPRSSPINNKRIITINNEDSINSNKDDSISNERIVNNSVNENKDDISEEDSTISESKDSENKNIISENIISENKDIISEEDSIISESKDSESKDSVNENIISDSIISDSIISDNKDIINGIKRVKCSNIKESDELMDDCNDTILNKITPPSSLQISKKDFLCMKIIGQFNNGFILCSLNGRKIIIDQHAASEIQNYEKIKKEKKIKKVKLIQPIRVNVNEVDELVVEENLETLFNNGFMVKKEKNGLFLCTLPNYLGVDLLYDDFLSFLDEVKEGEVFYTRYHDIMAYKACRMSVMIGDKMDLMSMERIVSDLGYLDKPWWCPHGRPVCRIVA